MKLFATLLLALACLAGPVRSQVEIPEDIQIMADSVEYQEDTNTVVASGSVRIEYHGPGVGDVTLTADSVSADLNDGKEVMTAEGHVTVAHEGRLLEGSRAIYNLKTREGVVYNALATVGKFYGRGSAIRTFPARVELMDASFTSCDLPQPDYRIAAKKITIIPGKEIRAERPTFYLGKSKIFSLPSYKRSIDPKRRHGSAYPMVGNSDLSGINLYMYPQISIGRKTTGILELRLSQRQLLTGGPKFDRILGSPFFLWALYKEEFASRRNVHILLNMLPYTGLSFGDLSPEPDKAISAAGQISWGSFKESPSSAKGWRTAATGQVVGKEIPVSPGVKFRLSATALVATYQTGNHYSYFAPVADIDIQRPFGFSGGLTYLDYIQNGQSPFLFDSVDLPRELRPRLSYNRPKWEIATIWRYDTTNSTLFDVWLSYTRRLHCIYPQVSYGVRDRSIRFNVILPAFGQTSYKGPGERAIGVPL